MAGRMAEGTKKVFLMRHAQSTYNSAIRSPATFLNPMFYFNGLDPGDKFLDARVSPKGQQQITATRKKLTALNKSYIFEKCELVVTSPLSRAMQTALGVTHDYRNLQVIAHPAIREVANASCDVGRSAHDLRAEFPSVDFELVPEDQEWWRSPNGPRRPNRFQEFD